MNHVTRDQLADALAAKQGLSTIEARKSVDVMIDALAGFLAEGKDVELRGLGSYTIKETKPRPGRNPMKPSHVMTIPSRLVVKFRPGKVIKSGLAKLSEERLKQTA
jgi:integration host factor subunit alpha